jgi:hypothetical protein
MASPRTQSGNLITPEAMRAAMRTRIEAGVSRHSISLLVCVFAKPDTWERSRGLRKVPRVAVERIRERERRAFLAELDRLHPSSDPGTEWLRRVLPHMFGTLPLLWAGTEPPAGGGSLTPNRQNCSIPSPRLAPETG